MWRHLELSCCSCAGFNGFFTCLFSFTVKGNSGWQADGQTRRASFHLLASGWDRTSCLVSSVWRDSGSQQLSLCPLCDSNKLSVFILGVGGWGGCHSEVRGVGHHRAVRISLVTSTLGEFSSHPALNANTNSNYAPHK